MYWNLPGVLNTCVYDVPTGFGASSVDLHESACPRTLATVWPWFENVQVTVSPGAMSCCLGWNSKSMTSVLQSNADAEGASTNATTTARGSASRGAGTRSSLERRTAAS